MSAQDERLMGEIFILYPLIIAIAVMLAGDFIYRVYRLIKKHRQEFLA